MKDDIFVEDENGDRKYFTMLPNIVLNHSTATDQALYAQLKKFAGENGIAYPSAITLMKKLGISRNTLKKSFGYLLERGWIKSKGYREVSTDGGIQKVKAYSIVDIWGLNAKEYERGVKIDAPTPQRGVNKGCQNSTPNKNHINKNHIMRAEVNSAFSYKEYLKKMEEDSRRHINVIGHFLEEKGLVFDSEDQIKEAIKRHLRPAMAVSKFPDEKIVWATKEAKKEYKELWTVETLLKILTR